jgi:hypothetical protein
MNLAISSRGSSVSMALAIFVNLAHAQQIFQRLNLKVEI